MSKDDWLMVPYGSEIQLEKFDKITRFVHFFYDSEIATEKLGSKINTLMLSKEKSLICVFVCARATDNIHTNYLFSSYETVHRAKQHKQSKMVPPLE